MLIWLDQYAICLLKLYRERLGHIILGSVGECLSSGISLLGCSRYFWINFATDFVMGDYSFAEKIKFVPTLHSRTSPSEYYDWEDAMEDFLHGRGLESHMKMHFVKHTFSKHVLQWWVELQQGHIGRGDALVGHGQV